MTMAKITAYLGKEVGSNTTLHEMDAREILARYHIPMNRYRLTASAEEAVEAAEDIGYPVVLKIVSPDIIHKSDIGGVKVNLASEEEVRAAYEDIMSSALQHTKKENMIGMTVQEMCFGEAEILIGMKRDSVFGPTVVIGAGGVMVELLQDYSLRICPVTREDVAEMLNELKTYKLLSGYRGRPETDIEAIIDVVMQVSRMSAELEDLEALDLNPVLVRAKGKGVVAVDARLTVKQTGL